MDKASLVRSFSQLGENARERYKRVLTPTPERPNTVGKHTARNYVHLQSVLAEADKTCPRAADTIRWLIWHEVLDAQRALGMVEMLAEGKDDD